VHAEDLVKEYHRRHPLESNKRAVGRGTKKLIRALLTPISPISPTDKVKAWLLASRLKAPFPLIRATPLPTNKYSPSPPTSLWPLRPFKLSRSGSQGRARETPGSSFSNSPTSCEPTSKVDGTRGRGPAVQALRNALLGTTRRPTSPRTLPCPTLPSGRGRPR